MKKNTRPALKPNERTEPSKASENAIVYGHYHKNGPQEFVAVGNKQYVVSEIKQSISRPIINKSKVKALIKSSRGKGPETALILRVLGPELTLRNKIDRLLVEANVATDFSKIAFQEASLLGSEVKKGDSKNRTDLSHLALCTIDGETAKDFDDAVYAEAKDKNIEVTVAIADVSHYVKLGSALDEEALARGTSIYYPGHCVPMLPEELSNGLCSLKPKVLRLALAVTFVIGPKGGLSRPQIREVVIKSKARLTYNQVQAFYDGQKAEPSLIPEAVASSLSLLKKAALLLRRNRERRGAIDFDIVESVVALNEQGEPLSVYPQARLESHRIIEDLMVATNEIVAQYFENKKIPCLYRVHEPPNEEKLENFFQTALAFGAIKAGSKTKELSFSEPGALQEVMSQYQKSAYKETLNTLMLRAMMQARYSEKNLMHFGLASPAYLHFTSPIRRYADLIVHRQLRYVLFEKKPDKKIPERAMAEIAESISGREIRATDLERKIARLFAATFMATRVGDSFDAAIVACTEFGFFVRVLEHHVEGLVHIATISKSHVNFVPEKMSLVVSGSNIKFMVGDKVKVKLINVNTDRGHIDFELVRPATEATEQARPEPKTLAKDTRPPKRRGGRRRPKQKAIRD